MKNWIKNKLIKLLGIDNLTDRVNELNKKINYCNSLLLSIDKTNKEVINKNDYLVNQFNIAADIYPKGEHSWAVISIQGKPEYVRFVNLSNRDMREIHDFLKQFEGINKNIDSPFQMKYLFQ